MKDDTASMSEAANMPENKLIDRSESMRRRAAREAYVIIDLTKYMQMYQKIFAG